MKFLLFVALILAVSSASDIKQEQFPQRCDAAVTKLGVSGLSFSQTFTQPFQYLKFLQDVLDVVADFKNVEESCEGYYVEVVRYFILDIVPADYRECTANVLDGVDGFYQMFVTIIQDSTDWYPITKAALVVIDEATEAIYACMNPGKTIDYPAFTKNNQFIEECAMIVAGQALPQAQKIYNREVQLDMNFMFAIMPIINDIKLKCVEPIQSSL